jgi:uncharacterized protein (TIGR02284 family)
VVNNSDKYILDKLEHLIAVAEDGEKGYENAVQDVKDIEMKNLFLRLSHERASYVRQLRALIAPSGEKVDREDGGPLGIAHRVLMDLKSVFTSGDKNSIIKACLAGEHAALENYKKALDESYITGETRGILVEHYTGIKHAITDLRDHESAGIK